MQILRNSQILGKYSKLLDTKYSNSWKAGLTELERNSKELERNLQNLIEFVRTP